MVKDTDGYRAPKFMQDPDYAITKTNEAQNLKDAQLLFVDKKADVAAIKKV